MNRSYQQWAGKRNILNIPDLITPKNPEINSAYKKCSELVPANSLHDPESITDLA